MEDAGLGRTPRMPPRSAECTATGLAIYKAASLDRMSREGDDTRGRKTMRWRR